MIKINLSKSIRLEILSLHWEDIVNHEYNFDSQQWDKRINSRKHSLVLKLDSFFRKNRDPSLSKLRDFLFNENSVNYKNLRKILLGTRSDLNEIISLLGPLRNKELFDIFCYSSFISRKWSRDLAQKLNVNVCPYCNRTFTYSIPSNNIRPQYDHFYPKSKYPYLALSLYNLVPCCAICNSKKSTHDPFKKDDNDDLIYPFEEGYETHPVFGFKERDAEDFISVTRGDSLNFEILVSAEGNDDFSKLITSTINLFSLKELYGKHKFHVQTLLKNNYIYNELYLSELRNSFPDLFPNKTADAYKFIFNSSLDSKDWSETPLSKLTYDIAQEIMFFSKEKKE